MPPGAQRAAAVKYLDALRAARYDEAFAMLAAPWHAYFGSAANFRSVYAADGYRLKKAALVGARGDARGRIFLTRETIAFVDHATDAPAEISATVPIGVIAEGGSLRIVDRGKPYRAFSSSSESTVSGVHVSVRKVEFFPDRIGVVVRFANRSDTFVTALPYGKSVLRDAKGGIYRLIATKNWEITDKRLFVGIPLAPNAQYTGEMSFAAPGRIDAGDPHFTLSVAPLLADGADEPFAVDVPIAPSASTPAP